MSAEPVAELAARVRFGADGLAPAIVQDAASGRVLTLAWMNAESLQRTLETGETWFWSRSRGELWHKGATSGNTQAVRAVAIDCDRDAVCVVVTPAGPACHTGAETCFHEPLAGGTSEPFAAIADLQRVIAARAAAADPDGSYTARLLAKGIDTVCKKVGEEATEVVIAAKGREREAVVRESADLLYHLAVLWQEAGVDFSEVADVLASRRRPA
ncbi:MAG: bifunctional phosphoribosyl-AMP cyclohydrolase/phosphoribosyl-ATP diphosphatase HisIE [Actinomycetota bacterium]